MVLPDVLGSERTKETIATVLDKVSLTAGLQDLREIDGSSSSNSLNDMDIVGSLTDDQNLTPLTLV